MTPPIRILQVITRLVRRGASRHVIDLARSLDPHRFDVEILAGQGEPHETSLWEDARATGLRLHYLEVLRRPIRPWADLAAYRSIREVIRHGHFDVVHTHISKSGLLGRLAARREGVRGVVHTYHGMVGELAGGSPVARLLRTVERRCARMTDVCITISHGAAEQLESAGIVRRGQCVVIPNGVDLEHYSRESSGPRPSLLPPGRRVIGTVGSLTPEKATGDLLQAAAKLTETHRDLLICVVGEGPLWEKLQAQAVGLGIADRVVFAGAVADVRPWLAAFDVLAMPSRSEGMPLTLIEAMAMGCPIVATDVGGVRETLGGAGTLVDVGDWRALVEALESSLHGGAGQAAAGELQVRRFGLSDMVARTCAIYEKVLG